MRGSSSPPEPQDVDVQSQHKQFVIVIVIAVLLGLAVNVLAMLLIPSVNLTWWGEAILLAVSLFLIVLGMYWVWRLLARRTLTRSAGFSIIYDVRDGEILPFTFESSFTPQDTARQAFDALLARSPEYRKTLRENLAERSRALFDRLRTGANPIPVDKHLFGHFVEYLIVRWIAGWIGVIVTAEQRWGLKEKEIGPTAFPSTLANNVFVLLVQEMKPADIVETALAQINLTVPEDFDFDYKWPLAEPHRAIPELMSGEFKLKGKYCTLYLRFQNSSWTPVHSVQGGRYLDIGGIPVGFSHMDYLLRGGRALYEIGFGVSFRADFSLAKLALHRRARLYFDLLSGLAESFTDHFDEGLFLQHAIERRERRVFADLAEKMNLLEEKVDRLLSKGEGS